MWRGRSRRRLPKGPLQVSLEALRADVKGRPSLRPTCASFRSATNKKKTSRKLFANKSWDFFCLPFVVFFFLYEEYFRFLRRVLPSPKISWLISWKIAIGYFFRRLEQCFGSLSDGRAFRKINESAELCRLHTRHSSTINYSYPSLTRKISN